MLSALAGIDVGSVGGVQLKARLIGAHFQLAAGCIVPDGRNRRIQPRMVQQVNDQSRQ